jgi:A/G-specific adenine glycosylase
MNLPRRELVAFRRQLLAWFRQFQRELPWRGAADAYRIWLSEIMLQQTRVAAVIPYYERFLQRFPDVESLAAAPQEEVLRLWSGLGYYSRARNLQLAAQQIADKHNGSFPQNVEDALALPGIGRYTAAAILSIAFGARLAVLDGNVARVLARVFAMRGDARESRRWQALQKAADKMLDSKAPGDWNQAMMELGAIVCTPRAPQCLLCPVAAFCRARKLGIAESLPAPRKKLARVDTRLASAVLLDARGRTLLLPPPHGTGKHAAHTEVTALVSRMWHFPTLAVDKNPAFELQEFLKQSLPSLRPRSLRFETPSRVRHSVTYRDIKLLVFRACVRTLPHVPGAKALPLSGISAPSSLAISNLTRKVARAALAASAEGASAKP